MAFKEFEYAEYEKRNDAFKNASDIRVPRHIYFVVKKAGIQRSNEASRYYRKCERVNYVVRSKSSSMDVTFR
jgi:hypothetical protein